MSKTGTEGQVTLSPEVEDGKERRKARQRFWSVVGMIFLALGGAADARIRSCNAESAASAAKKKAEDQAAASTQAAVSASSAQVASTVTEAQMTATYEDVLEKFEEIDSHIEGLGKQLEWHEKRGDLLESLILRSFGNRRAMRNYEAPPPPRRVANKKRKEMPKSPRDALRQEVFENPAMLFGD